MTTSPPAAAVHYDPYDADIDDDPYPTWTRLRDEAPLYRNEEHGFWALSRWDDVRPALVDWETYRSGRGTVLEIVKAGVEIPPGILLFEDPPIHDAHRTLMSRVFTPKRMLDLEPLVRQYTVRALDALLGRDEFDIIADFGVEIPLRTIGFLFGIPEADQDVYRKATDDAITTDGSPISFDQSSFDEVLAVLGDYVEWRSKNPGDDLMTELLNAEVDEPDGSQRPLTRDEVVTYASMIAGAGNETATRLIGFTLQLLAQHPDQRRQLVDDPSLVPNAIEEILRLESPSPVQARWVERDVDVHGTVIPEGSIMMLINAAANRDPRHWTNPDELDLHRDEGSHLSFGYGLHFCLGAALARLEGRVALEEILRRWPEWDVDIDRGQMAHTGSVRGWGYLPVSPTTPYRTRGPAMDESSSGDVKRVAVWSTGGIGSLSIVAVNERPDLELVGVWVHSEEKVGRDAGELANGKPIGVAATNDVGALLALEPDCVIYGASGPDRDAGAIADYERILAAGINVVTTTSTTLINPLAYTPAHRERLERATREGGSSIFASGIEPGFLCDQLPVILATASRSISKVHCHEIALYDDYGVEEIMVNTLGFGQSMDYEPWIMLPGAIASEFGGQVQFIADGLGVEVTEIRETYDRRMTEQSIETAFGTVQPGTCGAIRFGAIGVVDGREAIIIDHITRLARHVGTDWPIGEQDLSYRIVIEGKPNFDVWITPTLDDPAEAGIPTMGSGAGAMLATAMRVVNAVPYVVDAEPGLLRSLEMPITVPRHAFLA